MKFLREGPIRFDLVLLCLAILIRSHKNYSKMGDVAKDLISGTVGGAAQLIVGHPFDTIKVKLQSQPAPLPGQPPKFSGARDAVRKTIASEGSRGLYKGMGVPLATVAAFNALLFTVRGQMEALLRSEPGASLTVNQKVVAGAGAGAGVAVSFLACPTELIKCRSDFNVAMYSIFLSSLIILTLQEFYAECGEMFLEL